MDKLKLMKIAENEDCESFDIQDLHEQEYNKKKTKKQAYKEFYDDIKQPSDYIKEDW